MGLDNKILFALSFIATLFFPLNEQVLGSGVDLSYHVDAGLISGSSVERAYPRSEIDIIDKRVLDALALMEAD